MRIAIAGSSGLMGTALAERLVSDGHEVIRLVRRPARSGEEVTWDPAGGVLAAGALAGVDGVVNLAGAGVGDKRWTPEYKQVLRSSRLDSTAVLVDAMLGAAKLQRLVANNALPKTGDVSPNVRLCIAS